MNFAASEIKNICSLNCKKGKGSTVMRATHNRTGVVEHTPVSVAAVSKGVMWLASQPTAFTVPRATGCPRYPLTAGLAGARTPVPGFEPLPSALVVRHSTADPPRAQSKLQ